MQDWFRKPQPIRHTECPVCRRVMVCTELSIAYGTTVWKCEDGHVFDDKV